MYHKKILSICGGVQLLCGLMSLVLFLLQWKVFGLLIPVYAVGVIHIFCGAWCLVEVYRRARITPSLYTSGACISAASMAVAITLIAASSVDLKDVNAFAQYYRTRVSDTLVNDVDHVQVLIGFGFAYLVIGLTTIGAAATQFLICILRLVRDDGVLLPTRILENRLNGSVLPGRQRETAPYVKMAEEEYNETTI